MYSSQLDKISSFTMSSPHYIPTPKLVVFLKSSEKDQKSEEEKEDDGEEEGRKREGKLENENSGNVRKQTTASARDRGGDDDDDDGYRTPTSPCHRIPEVLKCPPAPKRRRRSERSSDELVLDCKEVFYSVMVCEIDEGDIMPKAKKGRGEQAAVANGNSNVG